MNALLRPDKQFARKVDALAPEFAHYCEAKRAEWIHDHPRLAAMVGQPNDQETKGAHEWRRFIAPLVEAWWAERGCGVVWPSNPVDSVTIVPLAN